MPAPMKSKSRKTPIFLAIRYLIVPYPVFGAPAGVSVVSAFTAGETVGVTVVVPVTVAVVVGVDVDVCANTACDAYKATTAVKINAAISFILFSPPLIPRQIISPLGNYCRRYL